MELPLPAVPAHFTRPRRSIMRLAALNTRKASGLRARYAPRAIIVLDRWGHRRRLLPLSVRLPRLDAGGCGSTSASSESALSPPVDAAYRALRPTSFSARPAVAVERRWREGQRCRFGFRAGMSFNLGCQLARGLWTAVRADGGCVPIPDEPMLSVWTPSGTSPSASTISPWIVQIHR